MRSRGLSRRAGKIPAGCARITQLLEIGVCCCIQMQDQRCCLKRPEHLPLGKLDDVFSRKRLTACSVSAE